MDLVRFQTNTFQLVIASDGRESFVLLLYPDAINWVQGDGKDSPVSRDVPGQAGFDAGDNERYYTLPGSGRPQVTQLARSAVQLQCSMCHVVIIVTSPYRCSVPSDPS